MSGWRQRIFQELSQRVGCIILVEDPDGLLIEERIASGLRSLGFDIVVFGEPIEFRYIYESKYRAVLEEVEQWKTDIQPPSLLVILSDPDMMRKVPFDVQTRAETAAFGFGDLFPNLSYSVISSLDTAELDRLWTAVMEHKPEKLGENLTKDFILTRVFDMMPAHWIRSEKDLLLTLMRRHYRARPIPQSLGEWFVESLRKEGRFAHWPLETIVNDRQAFLDFLQERWHVFVEKQIGLKVVAEARGDAGSAHMRVPGPVDIPFSNDEIKVFLDSFFLEGLLKAVPLDPSDYPKLQEIREPWMKVGIRTDFAEGQIYQINRLLDTAERTLPAEDATHDSWLGFSATWAQLKALLYSFRGNSGLRGNIGDFRGRDPITHGSSYGDYKEPYDRAYSSFACLQAEVDERFQAWMQSNFAVLYNLPAIQPVMVHHVPRYLSKAVSDSGSKVALVVIDGMAADQWVIIKDEVSRQESGIRSNDLSVFAWVPTLTPVSRQALFSGKIPMFIAGDLRSTSREKALWTQFWLNEGLREHEVGYVKLGGNVWSLDEIKHADTVRNDEYGKDNTTAEDGWAFKGDRAVLEQAISARVLGIVVGKIDRIAHGMELGTRGMHNQVRQWVSSGYLLKLLKFLADNEFRIFISSDHGNIEARGCGRPREGVVAETRGERVRIYPSRMLRQLTLREWPNAIEWEPIGLPDNCLPLIASVREAFVNVGETCICHGGICIEEVIVPFAEITFK